MPIFTAERRSKIPNNEGKACDAVIKVLEQRTGKKRANVRRPEIDGNGPPVELRLTLGTRDYAIEHTLIEAFPDQILYEQEFARFILPVTHELSGHLPGPAVYHLYCPYDARLGVKASELDKIREVFITWIRRHAQDLHDRNPERPTKQRYPHGVSGQIQAKPEGFPYEVRLVREAHWSLSPRHDGVLLAARFAPNDVEALRVKRLEESLRRKCPKLWRCKEEGSRTILVLEDNDISLSNHVLIGDGLAGLLAKRQDLPDEIYLVETAVDSWTVRLIEYDDEGSLLPEYAEFHANDLIDMTQRANHKARP